ncbi:MAG TPA: aldolase [Bacteroidetes bacterium]|nr:aldolase [Bacteroidota bacterium]
MLKRSSTVSALLDLSHDLGREDRGLAILGEGNTSARLSASTFLIKASGSNLKTLTRDDVVECDANLLLPLLDRRSIGDEEVEAVLMSSRLDSRDRKPSVEALFHAYLLMLPGIDFVGHTHATAVCSVLCSPRAREFAMMRLFPDEIVCCDVASVFVPYTDPGLPLAKAIRHRTTAFLKKYRRPPRVILLENHGIITIGRSIEAVTAAMLMAEKAARIWLGAASLGGPQFLPAKDIARIVGR